jgi:YVTN family beta-propeller protein
MHASLKAAGLASALVASALVVARARQIPASPPQAVPLVTGKRLTPPPRTVNVGSYPTTTLLAPNGRFVAVSSLGARSFVTILSAQTGQIVSQVGFNARPPGARNRQGLYLGLAFAPDGRTLYAARGSDNVVSVLALTDDGQLSDTGRTLVAPDAAGIALSADGTTLYAARSAGVGPRLTGELTIVPTAGGVPKTVLLPGYPLAVATHSGSGEVFVTSEQRACVSVIDPVAGRAGAQIPTGDHPAALLFDRAQTRLFVANAGSDTVSIVDPVTRRVVRTLLVRPPQARALPAASPLGLALSTDERTLFVACADLNAVAVVDLTSGQTRGYAPTGWYPTAVAIAGSQLFVASAKGINARNPNHRPAAIAGSDSPQYIQNLIEGTVSALPLGDVLPRLAEHTRTVLSNNRLHEPLPTLRNPGIEYVIYIIKENRTYDQVLGDLGRGNGDPSLCLFPRAVTPNQHALAERFVLLDNFYCAAEVSGDGWNYSTAGTVSEYVSRNVPYGYTGKNRPYDYEGANASLPAERLGIPDVATPPGGYLWDKALAKGISVRNYGMFAWDFDDPRKTPEEGTGGDKVQGGKTALVPVTSPHFRQYDTAFADSEAWVKHALPAAPKQLATTGPDRDPARITTWRREYQGYLKTGTMPRLMLVRLGRDHTAGTTAGASSPRAMVADNDYAVGQLVETVSRGPLWKKTAIVVLEDDAQNGYDHVDAHRSIAFVISPFVDRGIQDSRFYNTDSALRTIGLLLGTDPMTVADATAPPLAVFGNRPANAAPFTAILPAREIIGEVNTARAYRAADSARLIARDHEESEADEALNAILWHAIKGRSTPPPPRVYAFGARTGP